MKPSLDTLARYVSDLADLGARLAIEDRGVARVHKLAYRDLIGKAFTLRNLLQSRIAPGDRVMLWGPSGAAWAIAYYGCLLAGAVIVPVDANFSAAYTTRIQQHTGARLLLADAARAAALPGVAGIPFEALLELPRAFKPQAVVAAAPDALLEIVYTSGATAEPKGVMITHGNVLANLRPIEQEVRKYKRWARPLLPLRFVHLIPLSHLFGQVMGLLIPPLLDSAVVYLQTQAAAGIAAAVRDTHASVVIAVPQQVELLGQWALAQLQTPPLPAAAAVARGRGRSVAARWWMWRRLHRRLGWRMWAFIVGAAALPAEQEELWHALGYAVVQGYGLTETAPAVAITHPFKIRRGSVGRKLAGMEIRIAPDGEILVRGPNVSPGYYRNPAATAETLADGWLRTGDLGELDAEGNLIYKGRKKEVIVTAEGLNVYPDDVEQALDAQPEIRESAVVAAENQGRAQVHAVVVLRAPLDAAALAAAVGRANEQLETHQRIAGYSLWPEPALPRTPSTRKLQRVRIAQWVNHRAGPAAPPRADTWRDYLVERLRVSPERLSPAARLAEDLGLGSLDRVELLAWLNAHGYAVEEAGLAEARTVADLESLLAAPPVPPAAAAAGGAAGLAVSRPGSYVYPRWPARAWVRWLRAPLQSALIFPLLRTVAKVEAHGREHLAGLRRPVLFIANHQSMLDVPVILRALPRPWRRWLAPAMALDAFRAYFEPGHGPAARRRARRRYHLLEFFFNIFVLAERTGIQGALRRAGELADRGYCPLIFPEGARTPDGRLHAFRPGIGVFVRALQLPVVPVVIEGLFEILPVGAERAHRGRARVTFGTPIHLSGGDDPAAITAILQTWFETQLGKVS